MTVTTDQTVEKAREAVKSYSRTTNGVDNPFTEEEVRMIMFIQGARWAESEARGE